MTLRIKKFIPAFLIDSYHSLMAFSGALIFGFPSSKIKVIGVTGTNGKSTVVDLITRIFEEAGYRVATSSSIKFKIREREWRNELRMTMPGRLTLQRFLRNAVKAGCQYAIIEVTSEGVKQHRHCFINFQVAVFTNLSPEHIETHGSFENYKRAKARFFQAVKKVHVINLDDENADYFLGFPADKKYLFGIRKRELRIKNRESGTKKEEIILARDVKIEKDYSLFMIHNSLFKVPLIGKFNVYNALAAISTALSQGIDLAICQRALEKAKGVPGRMEMVVSEPFLVFIDYAFTPNALKQVYQTIKENFAPRKLICVLGACGGGRDKWKRPVLGQIAARFCDRVIVTNEDPYDEDPMEIINQVANGASNKAEKILDRREAIRQVLKGAQPGDSVVITGKGCEPSICLAEGKRIPWDEKRVVEEEMAKIRP